MNTFVIQFVEQFQREAVLAGTFRTKLGKAEIAFLEDVWGPAFQYDLTVSLHMPVISLAANLTTI